MYTVAFKYKLFFTSVILNLLLLLFFLVWIVRKGGISYLVVSIFSDLSVNPTKNPYYYSKITQFNLLPSGDNAIIFLGDSITELGEWGELFNKVQIKNRGISGDTTTGLINRLEQIAKTKPQKIFIMIGINDILLKQRSSQAILDNYQNILGYFKINTPNTKVYIQSILPVNNNNFQRFKGSNQQVIEINRQLQKIAPEFSYEYINLYDHFINEQNQLALEYTEDGIHLNGKGYLLWKQLIEKFIT